MHINLGSIQRYPNNIFVTLTCQQGLEMLRKNGLRANLSQIFLNSMLLSTWYKEAATSSFDSNIQLIQPMICDFSMFDLCTAKMLKMCFCPL